MADQYALIDADTGKVVNVIVWDGDTKKFRPREGLRIEPLTGDATIGDVHDGQRFTRPEPDQAPRRKDRLDRVLDALVTRGVLTRQQVDDL